MRVVNLTVVLMTDIVRTLILFTINVQTVNRWEKVADFVLF